MKKIVRKILVNVIMAITMIAIGYSVATAMYSAGFRFNLPKITIEYDTEDHDLRLIDFADGEPLATEAVTK